MPEPSAREQLEVASRDLLIELGTEELPPKVLREISRAFAEAITAELSHAELTAGTAVPYATPRRLAVLVQSVAPKQIDRVAERRGPALTAAFDEEGTPTQAALGFARACGVEVDSLEKLETDKGAWLSHRSIQVGRPISELAPDIVKRALTTLPIPRHMRWGDGEEEFIRPVHWVVLLYGTDPIEATILGISSGRETRGHRFHHPEPLYLSEPSAYAPLLESEGRVMPEFSSRREAIRGQVQEAAVKLGGHALIDPELLEEVTALVEWPVSISGSFDEHYLEVPPEVLISTMQDHQRYFPVVDRDGKLMPYFIAVSNIESSAPQKIREGNERVIRPRFSDAAFFWEQDRRRSLVSRLDSLKSVVFQDELGSLYEKAMRTRTLCDFLARELDVDAAALQRAAELSKCDLQTQMVYEFPKLQGVMGRHYALSDGEAAEVAQALDEQYWPRHAGDKLPRAAVGQILAIADKVDTLVSIFAIGQKPTGVKDPFGLRRAALGVLRIIIECEVDLDLGTLLRASAETLPETVSAGDVVTEVFDYMLDRLRPYYAEQGVAHDVIEAVIARRPSRPLDLDHRIRAVAEFRNLPEATSLAAANKRTRNILKRAPHPLPEAVDETLLQEEAEKFLYSQVSALGEEVGPLFARGDYGQALKKLSRLKDPVDCFFDDVLVMADESALKRNRIALLSRLTDLFLRVADLSRLQH